MSTTATTRYGWTLPNGDDPISNGDNLFRSFGAAIDAIMASAYSGTIAARPAAAILGRFYKVTDDGTNANRIDFDTGSSWLTINPVAAVDAAAGVGSLRTLGTTALKAAAGNDARFTDQRVPTAGSVDASKIANNAVVESGIAAGAVALAKLKTDALQNFLQLQSAATKKIVFGTTNVTFAANTNVDIAATHSLGVTATQGFAIVAAGIPLFAVLNGINNTSQLGFRIYHSPGTAASGGPFPVFWVVFTP